MNSARVPITIAHRGADSEAAARLHERLSRELGTEHVVRFAERPLPGIQRPDTGVLLVIIGPLWVHARGVSGQRGLGDPRDPVRVQIERALRANVPCFPFSSMAPGSPRQPIFRSASGRCCSSRPWI